jgi:hypothetical protein
MVKSLRKMRERNFGIGINLKIKTHKMVTVVEYCLYYTHSSSRSSSSSSRVQYSAVTAVTYNETYLFINFCFHTIV